ARHSARRNPGRTHQTYYSRARERSGADGSRRERLDARDRGRNPQFSRHVAGNRLVGGAQQRLGSETTLPSATCSTAPAQPARCRCGLPPSAFASQPKHSTATGRHCLGPFAPDPSATARIIVIARPNFRRLCAGDYGTLCDIRSSWGGVSAMSAYVPDNAGTIVPFAPTPKEQQDTGAAADDSGRTIVALLQKAAHMANEDCKRAMDLAHKLSFQLRASEERVREAEAEAAHFRDRAARAEAWLVRIHNEVEQMFFPKRERDPNNTSRQ